MKNIYSLLFTIFLAGLMVLPVAKVSAGNKDTFRPGRGSGIADRSLG